MTSAVASTADRLLIRGLDLRAAGAGRSRRCRRALLQGLGSVRAGIQAFAPGLSRGAPGLFLPVGWVAEPAVELFEGDAASVWALVRRVAARERVQQFSYDTPLPLRLLTVRARS